MTVRGDSTSSLTITFGAAPNSSSVAVYKASINGRSCEVAADNSPLSCIINGLSSGSLYTVQAVACLPNGDCSAPAYGAGSTLPEGELLWKLVIHIHKKVV